MRALHVCILAGVATIAVAIAPGARARASTPEEVVNALLDADDSVDFEYEGEMAPDAALNRKVMELYPFNRLSGPANVLVMPGLQSANLSAKLLSELGGDSVIGPMLVGMAKPVQVATMTATASDLVTLAVLAAGGIAG